MNKILELIKPYGGKLKNLYLTEINVVDEKIMAFGYRSWNLTPQQLCDVELLLNGSCSPLDGFMGSADYENVLSKMHLLNGTFWPVPITLKVSESFAQNLKIGDSIALRDVTGVLIAVMDVSDIWLADNTSQSIKCFRYKKVTPTEFNSKHSLEENFYLGGKLKGIEHPKHYDFNQYRNSPAELREIFRNMGWARILALHAGCIINRNDLESANIYAKQAGANLILQHLIGEVKAGDINNYSRVRYFENVIQEYYNKMILNILPLNSHPADIKEIFWHAIICRNYGCTHLAVIKNHIDFTESIQKDFSSDENAYELVNQYKVELGIEIIPLPTMHYVEDRRQYLPVSQIKKGETIINISNIELISRLNNGLEIPAWFLSSRVLDDLKKMYPPRHKKGFTVFLTGLSGAGKSTIANALVVKLMEMGDRAVSLLDGDVVRQHLSSELGFSKEGRNINILRIGYVASEITKNGGVAICAPIAPYSAARRQVRNMIENLGGFVEVYVATPLETCEQRDRKGLYAKARAGLINEFTGISDPYEIPEKPELKIDTRNCTPNEAAELIVVNLKKMGFIK